MNVHTVFQSKTICCRWLLFFLITSLFLNGCVSQPPQTIDRQNVTAALNSLLDSNVRNQDGEIYRNVILSIEAPTVDFDYSGAAGIARVDQNEPISVGDQFFIASVGKTMTAVIIHQMAEEGVFGEKGVDTPLAELNVFPAEVMSQLHLIDGKSYANEITLRHLLNHTSGLRDVFFDGYNTPVSLTPGSAATTEAESFVAALVFDEEYGLTPLVRCSLEGIPAGCNPDDYLLHRRWKAWDYEAWQSNPQDRMAGLLNYFLSGMNEHGLWRPGQGYHYGDTNYLLLGIVIEELSGNSLHHELRSRIFDVLEMDNTYLIGAVDPSAGDYEKRLIECWGWGEPTISGGVNYSFDWGGGGIATDLPDLTKFTRALFAGQLFQKPETLDDMLVVPENIQGIHYASGLMAFPTDQGKLFYMMGSNGTWAEYYQPLDLVMAGTTNDLNDMPRQFQLHAQIYQILASHGLVTPMARLASIPMAVTMICAVLWLALLIILLFTAFNKKLRTENTSSSRRMRWMAAAAFLLALPFYVSIGNMMINDPFQMLYGFSALVRTLSTVTAIVTGAISLIMAALAIKSLKQEKWGFERVIFIAATVVAFVNAVSMGLLV